MTKEEEYKINLRVSYNIKQHLEKSGKTKKDLADFMGVSAATVTYWCNGERLPRMNKIDKMCIFFSCSRSDLIDDPKDKIQDPGKLSDEEKRVILLYRTADPSRRAIVREILENAPKRAENASA